MYQLILGARAKTALLQILVVGWLVRFANVLFVRWGFFFCAVGEKNKINSLQVCTEVTSKSLTIFSCLFIQRVNVSKVEFRSITLAYNLFISTL
jgi:hypothetical protein